MVNWLHLYSDMTPQSALKLAARSPFHSHIKTPIGATAMPALLGAIKVNCGQEFNCQPSFIGPPALPTESAISFTHFTCFFLSLLKLGAHLCCHWAKAEETALMRRQFIAEQSGDKTNGQFRVKSRVFQMLINIFGLSLIAVFALLASGHIGQILLKYYSVHCHNH